MNLSLKNETKKTMAKGFYIQKIVDKREFMNKIGAIYKGNAQKEDVFLNDGVHNEVSNFLQKNVTQNINSLAITLIIKELSLSETKMNDGKIEGKMLFVVQFEKKVGNENVKVSEATFGNNFTRSIANNNPENYEQMLQEMLLSSIEYFNKWLEKNGNKSDAFAKGSRVVLLPDINRNSEDTLSFSINRKLTWNDFKGNVPMNT